MKVVSFYVGDSDGGLTKLTDHYLTSLKSSLFEIKPQRDEVLNFSFHKNWLNGIPFQL